MYEEFPYDFRIVAHYIDLLCEKPKMNKSKIEDLSPYILDETIGNLIYLYSSFGEYSKAEEYAAKLPVLWLSKEFSRAYIYPEDDERFLETTVEFVYTVIERLIWTLFCITINRKDDIETEIFNLENILKIAECVYPDFDCDVCHSALADICFALYKRYTAIGNKNKALDYLELAVRHERELDETDDIVIRYTSPFFKGFTYDMRKTWDGTPESCVEFMINKVLSDESASEYTNDSRFEKSSK